jgi:hypothetical protein
MSGSNGTLESRAMTLQEVVSATKAKRAGNGYLGTCPCHDDRAASLSITAGEKQPIVVNCQAGCDWRTVRDALGISRSPNGSAAPLDEIAYEYTDANSKLLYQVVRRPPKNFTVRRPDLSGGWTYGLGDVERVPYGLPEIVEAAALGKTIYVVEGEKDCESLKSLGLIATTNSGGAAVKWTLGFAEHFRGAIVRVIPDNDEPGRAHAKDVIQKLAGVAESVRLVELPGIREKGDVTDWLQGGGTVAELGRLSLRSEDSTAPDAETATLDDVVALFQRWLWLPDALPLYAVLGAIAANHLPGDPVWLGLVAPPSSAKTEILNATSGLPDVHPAATLTPASLLSGTSKREKVANAKGGLLKQIGDFGILVLKDFGSILSMRPDAKAEILAALREIFDGSWTRHVGTDGGQSLSWQGKIGLIFGVTPALDSHHSVIGSMGERFLLCRLQSAGREQATRALKHSGNGTAAMRRELALVVSNLFAGEQRAPRELAEDERNRLIELASLAVRIRSTVERDRQSREIESIHGAEGPARLVLSLERLLAGLDVIGCDRTLALSVIERVAMDSVPPLRRRALEWLTAQEQPTETKSVGEALGLPTNTTRRVLEDLAAYSLVKREGQGQGLADLWSAGELT